MENVELLENELPDMNYRDRLNAIADDLISGKDKYRAISPHYAEEICPWQKNHYYWYALSNLVGI
jgi:hypothetical protein